MVATGHEEDPPVTLAGSQSYIMAIQYLPAAALMALHHAPKSGRGQQVDISVQEAMLAVTSICGVGKWLDDGIVSKRFGTGLFSGGPVRGLSVPRWECVPDRQPSPGHWQALARWVNEVTGNEDSRLHVRGAILLGSPTGSSWISTSRR